MKLKLYFLTKLLTKTLLLFVMLPVLTVQVQVNRFLNRATVIAQGRSQLAVAVNISSGTGPPQLYIIIEYENLASVQSWIAFFMQTIIARHNRRRY